MATAGGDKTEKARKNCEETWQQALARCKEILGEDDYELVLAYENPDDLLKAIDKLRCAYTKGIIVRLLKNIRPELSHLQTFALAIILGLQPSSINAACIWGTAQLLIELASRSEAALREVFEMLSDIGQSLKLFEIYSSTISLDSQLLEELFEILVDLVLFSVSAIKHFRRNEIETATMIITWSNVRASFTTVAQNISKKVNRLKERIEAENMKQLNTTQARLVASLKNLGITGGAGASTALFTKQDVATLPCNTLSLPRNPGFYGRSSVLEQITAALQEGTEKGIRSIALWGTGGIGKSQIALEYASRQLASGTPVILWISGETAGGISAGFNRAAQQLQLPGYQNTNTPDQNRYEVLQWVQNTNVPWLIVFDNIEKRELLHQNWPVHGSGSILVTCRSEMMAAAPAASAIEVPKFTNQEGAELILKILSREEEEGDDEQCASELSEKLGGLALAIDMMAKQIRTRKKTIKQFKLYYDEHYKTLHKLPKRGIYNPYYSKGLDAVWNTAFENLEENAQSFMALLTYFATESIPQRLWEGPQKLKVNSRFSFLCDSEEVNDATLELLDSALVSVNPRNSMMSIHRLVQVAFRDRLSPEDTMESFNAALTLLRNSFPEQLDGQHLRGQWEVCEPIIQHVRAFGQRYVDLVRNGFEADLEVLTMLFSDAAWYLHETGAHKDTLEMLEMAFQSCKSLDSIAYSNLCVTAGTVYDQRGQGRMATTKFLEVIEIREKLLPWNHPELANAYNNVAVSLTGIYRPAEALEYLERAIKIDLSFPPEDQIKGMIDMRYRNLARTHVALGHYPEAKDALVKAQVAIKKKHTPQAAPYYHAEYIILAQMSGSTQLINRVNHIYAKIAMIEDKFDDARGFAESARTDFAKNSTLHPALASACYRLGCIYIRQQALTKALECFEEALGICQLREVHKGDRGETARVKWRISQIKDMQGEHVEAETLRLSAEATYDALHATGKYTPGVDKEQGFDNLISFLYR